MNKSKFLKKSLAMLLAVMLVVAMIPLSASAESRLPDLTALTVGGNTVAVESDGTTFKADVPATASTVAVVADLSLNATLTATNKDNEAVGIDTLTLADFNTENGAIKVPLTLTSEDETNTKSFVLLLTKTTLKTTTNLKSATPTADTGIISASINNNAKVINVQVVKGYVNDGKLTLVADDNATLSATTLEDIEDGAAFTVTSESNKNVANWTVKLQEVNVLTAFKAGDVAATINQNDKEITAEYPNSILKDEDGADVSDLKLATTFTVAYAGAVVKYYNGTDFVVVKNGDKPNYLPAINTTGAKIVVGYLGIDCDYDLKLTTAAQTEKDITEMTIDGETATISGSKITADVAKTNDLTAVKFSLTTSSSVTGVSMIAPGASSTATGLTATVSADGATKSWTTSAGTANFTKGATITVTAADGTTKQYTVTVNATLAVDEAVLKSFTLKDGTKEYNGTISAGKITVTVPYMTKNMNAWNVYATANPGAQVKVDAADFVTGKTVTENGITGLDAITAGTDITVAQKINVVSKADASIKSTYTLVVKFEAYKSGKTMTAVSVTSADSFKAISSENTYKAVSSVKNKENLLTFTIPYSVNEARTALATNEFTVAAGGVALLVDTAAANNVDAVLTGSDKTALGTVLANDKTILVLPERYAKTYDVDGKISAADLAKGTLYKVVVTAKAAETGSALRSIKVGDTTLTVAPNKISGKIPYSMTVAATRDVDADHSYFVEFTASTFAKLTDGTTPFVNKGDTNGDGEADAASPTNMKLAFVRKATGDQVEVYTYDGSSTVKIASLTVAAEDKVNKTIYDVADATDSFITYAPANTDAAITSFKLAGATGTITGRTINVTVPYNTNVSALAPSFTASSGAKVQLGLSTVVSGETLINFTNDVTLKVTSEDENKAVSYTVKTTVASQFNDVKEGSWYYSVVMTAAANGWIEGDGKGNFLPNNSMKRGDFAVMMARVMGADLTQYTTSAFPDVASSKYYSSAIAFCADKGYISGDEKGRFNAEATINREQMAKIICEAKGLTQVTNPAKKFADDAKISKWAKGYVYACAEAGIFEGDEKNNFNPKSNAKRSEAAAVLVRAFA